MMDYGIHHHPQSSRRLKTAYGTSGSEGFPPCAVQPESSEPSFNPPPVSCAKGGLACWIRAWCGPQISFHVNVCTYHLQASLSRHLKLQQLQVSAVSRKL